MSSRDGQIICLDRVDYEYNYIMIYHQSYVTSQHSLHLKNNKKIYDQLHKRDLRTFIIRKY